MQLRNARVCLDCEELHEQQVCPVCASEAFAFVTRWVPVSVWNGRNRRRPKAEADGPPSTKLKTWVTRGIAGVAMFGVGRMFLETILARPDRSGQSVPTRDRRRVAGVTDPTPLLLDSLAHNDSDGDPSDQTASRTHRRTHAR